ncbi:uncharacterized protein CLAFUR5_05229 [Fulvia fulva]|uniref:Uncharacterized protein n=1 Tax=Passalora fulva TaxID=5499 RepID=A0A9Q8LGS3_PASFU|nr:uncharacterized protein CLAFUR5_05229 [Fulvia fulva]KAK4617330.1 hypothetical protein CLAFUR0_10623 [Fulvia fulva]UJO16343.1 hypothetical protein CLAFUR5_05229 [Fulvia fulva]
MESQPPPPTRPFDPTPKPGFPVLPAHIGRSAYTIGREQAMIGGVPRAELHASIMQDADNSMYRYRKMQKRIEDEQKSRDDDADSEDGLDDLEELERRIEAGDEGDDLEDIAAFERAPTPRMASPMEEGMDSAASGPSPPPRIAPVSRFLPNLDFSGDAYDPRDYDATPQSDDGSDRTEWDGEQQGSKDKEASKKRSAGASDAGHVPKRKKRAPRGYKTLKSGEVVPSTRKRNRKVKGEEKVVEEDSVMKDAEQVEE